MGDHESQREHEDDIIESCRFKHETPLLVCLTRSLEAQMMSGI